MVVLAFSSYYCHEGGYHVIESVGFNVEYVGALISDSIKAGYVPMVF